MQVSEIVYATGKTPPKCLVYITSYDILSFQYAVVKDADTKYGRKKARRRIANPCNMPLILI
jgi:hypothetical protein